MNQAFLRTIAKKVAIQHLMDGVPYDTVVEADATEGLNYEELEFVHNVLEGLLEDLAECVLTLK